MSRHSHTCKLYFLIRIQFTYWNVFMLSQTEYNIYGIRLHKCRYKIFALYVLLCNCCKYMIFELKYQTPKHMHNTFVISSLDLLKRSSINKYLAIHFRIGPFHSKTIYKFYFYFLFIHLKH